MRKQVYEQMCEKEWGRKRWINEQVSKIELINEQLCKKWVRLMNEPVSKSEWINEQVGKKVRRMHKCELKWVRIGKLISKWA